MNTKKIIEIIKDYERMLEMDKEFEKEEKYWVCMTFAVYLNNK